MSRNIYRTYSGFENSKYKLLLRATQYNTALQNWERERSECRERSPTKALDVRKRQTD